MGDSTISSRNVDNGRIVLLEEDSRVAYAYLISGKQVLADVWLYNCISAPLQPEWKDPAKAPFLNPESFATDLRPKSDLGQLTWHVDSVAGHQDIYIEGKLWARLQEGCKPGWSVAAKKDGPLAKVF